MVGGMRCCGLPVVPESPVGRPEFISILTHVESYPKASASQSNLSLPLYATLYVFSYFDLVSQSKKSFLFLERLFLSLFFSYFNQLYTTTPTHTPARNHVHHQTSYLPLTE